MRRASAISLLAAIGFSLIAPGMLLQAESNLPACCRRNGAHHCAMSLVRPESDSGTSVAGVHQTCSSFPMAVTAPAGSGAALPRPAAAMFSALLSHPSIQFQTESRYRVSFSRCRQKRGPPFIVS
ncbi:MAG: hypothetical protein ACLQU1_19420 [Bryobacteraceae bacterium]